MFTKRYQELIQLDTFDERYEYLRLGGTVGESTFGFERWMNQAFYRSNEWRRTRREIVARDLGCDLGVLGRDIHENIIVHHLTPLRPEDVEDGSYALFNPDNLICVSLNTHNAIHYGDRSILPQPYVERRPNDTIPWRT